MKYFYDICIYHKCNLEHTLTPRSSAQAIAAAPDTEPCLIAMIRPDFWAKLRTTHFHDQNTRSEPAIRLAYQCKSDTIKA